MSRRRAFDRMGTALRLRDIGGPDRAIRYLEFREQSQRSSDSARSTSTPSTPATPRRSVCINGIRICDDEVSGLERAWGVTVQDGAYWYDAKC